VKRRDLIAHLLAEGCFLVREGARHSWWGNPRNNRRSAVPRHSEISDFIARKICRDLGIASP
jgi:mRNA interferase HicA